MDIVKDYINRDSMNLDKKKQNKKGFRTKHINILNNRFRVTFTNDPDILPPPKRRLTEAQFIKELALNSQIELI